MEEESSIVPVLSLVPSSSIVQINTLNRKYWHIVCKADLVIPHGLQFIKASFFLIWYNHRFYFAFFAELVSSISEEKEDLEFLRLISSFQIEDKQPRPALTHSLPLAFSVFQLSNVPSSFWHYAQNCQNGQY